MPNAEPKWVLHDAFAAWLTAPEDEERRAAAQVALWICVTACEEARFETVSGLPFTYTVKTTRSGTKGCELRISRKKKTVTRSSVLLSLDRLLQIGRTQGTLPVRLTTPRQLGTFGASYIFPLFIRFGLAEYSGK